MKTIEMKELRALNEMEPDRIRGGEAVETEERPFPPKLKAPLKDPPTAPRIIIPFI